MDDDFLLRPVSMLRAEGWNSRQLRTALADGRLGRPARGVYGSGMVPPGTAAHLARAEAILMRQGASVVVSHVSAAIAHGLPVQVDDPAEVHLTTPPPARGRRRSGYHVHVAALRAEGIVEVGGLRVTSLARTAADLARTVSYGWGVIGADAALRRGVTRDELLAFADAGVRLAGVGTLRSVAAFADGRAESVRRVTMVRAGIPRPALQVPVNNESGWVADGDFGWEEFDVIGEADGDGKLTQQLARQGSPEKVIKAHAARDQLIRQAGWWPTHWGWDLAWSVRGLGDHLRAAFEASRTRGRPG